MANAIAEGIRAEGAHADLFSVAEFGSRSTADYAKLALGCPSMGAEVLEECEFEPFLCSIEPELAGKKVALFGSFGWGDGEWMRNWEDRMKGDNCALFEQGLIINLTPDDEAKSSAKSSESASPNSNHKLADYARRAAARRGESLKLLR